MMRITTNLFNYGLNEVKSPPATGSQRLTERPQGFAYQSENLDANRELKRNNQGPSSKDQDLNDVL